MFWDSAGAGLVMHDVVRCLLWLGAALLGNSGQKPKEQHSRTCNNFDVWTDYLFKRKLWYFCVRCRHWTPSSVNKMAPHPGCANRMKAQIMCRDLVGYSYNVVVCVVVCVCVLMIQCAFYVSCSVVLCVVHYGFAFWGTGGGFLSGSPQQGVLQVWRQNEDPQCWRTQARPFSQCWLLL